MSGIVLVATSKKPNIHSNHQTHTQSYSFSKREIFRKMMSILFNKNALFHHLFWHILMLFTTFSHKFFGAGNWTSYI